MENFSSISSPEIKKDIFDEYLQQPIYVLSSLDGVEASSQEQYQEVSTSNRIVYVRNDVMKEIERKIKFHTDLDKRSKNISGQGVFHQALRPIFKKRYETKDREKKVNDDQKNWETRNRLIEDKEVEEIKRIEIAEFVATFPLAVQKSLKDGVFLINTEGKYSESVENGTESFASANDKGDFKSIKGGSWERGLLQTLQAGSPFVKSFLASNITGAYSTFKAELKDDIVSCTVTGTSFSTFGDNDLGFSLEYEEFGEKKKVYRAFKPF